MSFFDHSPIRGSRLHKQLEFLAEVDKMKTIMRRTLLADGSRQESDAEHSWHIALMAMVLYEHANCPEVNLLRVIKMTLVHDLVEVYAGDTFAYDAEGYESKAQREQIAAEQLFGMLPEDQEQEIRELWEEFDAMETPDALYAAALDRVQPLINNYLTNGHTWKHGDVTSDMVYKRIETVKESLPALWSFVEFMIEDSIQRGILKEPG